MECCSSISSFRPGHEGVPVRVGDRFSGSRHAKKAILGILTLLALFPRPLPAEILDSLIEQCQQASGVAQGAVA